MGKLMATRVLVGPVLHGLEHIPVNLDGVVAGSGMMECTEHIVDNFIHGNTSVFPCIQDTTRFVSSQRSPLPGINLRDSVLQDCGSNTAST